MLILVNALAHPVLLPVDLVLFRGRELPAVGGAVSTNFFIDVRLSGFEAARFARGQLA